MAIKKYPQRKTNVQQQHSKNKSLKFHWDPLKLSRLSPHHPVLRSILKLMMLMLNVKSFNNVSVTNENWLKIWISRVAMRDTEVRKITSHFGFKRRHLGQWWHTLPVQGVTMSACGNSYFLKIFHLLWSLIRLLHSLLEVQSKGVLGQIEESCLQRHFPTWATHLIPQQLFLWTSALGAPQFPDSDCAWLLS